jgi:hypothetical protein
MKKLTGQARRAQRRLELRKERMEKGLCLNCSSKPTWGFFCDKHREIKRNRRKSMTLNGQCLDCAEPKLPGHSRCIKHMEHIRKYLAERRGKLKEDGICVSCAKGIVVKGVCCEECKKKIRERQRKRKADLLAAGLCYVCGKENHLPNSKYCERCFLRNLSREHFGTCSEWEYLRDIFYKNGCRCVYSNLPIVLGLTAELDHRVPFAKGGSIGPENVQWVHTVVNQMKWSYPEEQFLEMVKAIYLHSCQSHG